MGYTIDPLTKLTAPQLKILNIIIKLGHVSPRQISEVIDPPIGAVMIQRHLKNLVEKGFIRKFGLPPKVFYASAISKSQGSDLAPVIPMVPLTDEEMAELNRSFGFDADFTLYRGIEAFRRWYIEKQVPSLIKQKGNRTSKAERISENPLNLLKRFLDFRSHLNTSIQKENGLINATQRFQSIHPHPAVQEVFYCDFYSVPQFGKTLLGLIVQKAKVGEESSLPYIKEIRDILIQYIPYLIVKFKCDAVIWVPHTIKRRVPLQDFLAKELKLCIPIIPVTKIVIKDIVPQKTLSELNRRLENATLTNHVTESVDTLKRYTNVLIIDDAIGSGATIQAIGCNLKNLNQHLNIFALAIVGSYKGFDVIKDI